MVRLISSRLHRCYSRRGVQKSARIEKFSTLLHVVACFGLLISTDWSIFSSPPLFTIPSFVPILATFLLVVVHLSDFFATFTAHRKFYRWSKVYKAPGSFLSTPTKVDALCVAFYLCGSIVLFASTCGLTGKLRAGIGAIPPFVSVSICVASVLATAVNLVLSLPSLDFGVPTGLARLQNLIVTGFCIASIIKLHAAVLPTFIDLPAVGRHFLMKMAMAADIAILAGSLLNVVRVARFLTKTRYWAMEELKGDGERNRKGLLSWFKSSRTAADASDIDSDDMEEFDMDLEDDEWQKPSSRRAAL